MPKNFYCIFKKKTNPNFNSFGFQTEKQNKLLYIQIKYFPVTFPIKKKLQKKIQYEKKTTKHTSHKNSWHHYHISLLFIHFLITYKIHLNQKRKLLHPLKNDKQ